MLLAEIPLQRRFHEDIFLVSVCFYGVYGDFSMLCATDIEWKKKAEEILYIYIPSLFELFLCK